MHIPDGFLNLGTAAGSYVISAGGISYAVRQANLKLRERHVPLMGVMAAFIFAAQMLNFPVAGGTSGHLVGAALAAILLGPWASVLIMTSVLIVQALLFQDGGLTALGANILNMGLVASFLGYYTYRAITAVAGQGRRSLLVSGFAGAWVATVGASLACAVELSVSGIVPLQIALPAMGGIHALIGIGEGLITTAVLSLVLATRADLLKLQRV